MSRRTITLTLTFDADRKLTKVTCPRCKTTLMTVVKLVDPHREGHNEIDCLAGITFWHPAECKRKWFR